MPSFGIWKAIRGWVPMPKPSRDKGDSVAILTWDLVIQGSGLVAVIW